MDASSIDSLHRLARLYRVTTKFRDGFHELRQADPGEKGTAEPFKPLCLFRARRA